MRVTALAGGTGAAKLLRGLAACLSPRELTIIGNTGDDTEVWGLHVSPDLDTVTYALGGVLDVARGWGRAEETFRCREVMATLGAPAWFSLGDRDLAVHLIRTAALRAGEPLSAITARLAAALRRRVPAAADERSAGAHERDDDRGTASRSRNTSCGTGRMGDVVARGVRRRAGGAAGAGRARGDPGADLVIVCPSNPVTSIGPILAVPGIAEALASTPAPVVGREPDHRGRAGQRAGRAPDAGARA